MSPISVVDRLAGWRERPLEACAIAATAIVACVVSLIAAPGWPGWFGAALVLIAIAIAVIDARYFIIPNELSAACFALALGLCGCDRTATASGSVLRSAARCCARAPLPRLA